jgi:hypothetical protein
MIHTGQCHCGKLKASFETEKTPAELGVRTCQCEFCRRHGAINISDPHGEVVIDAAPEDLFRYRFALKTADFLLCRHCGVYIAAVTGEGAEVRSTLNVAGLRMMEFLSVEDAPMEYGSETAEQRVARRCHRWTPTRFVNAELNASYYGPH